MWLKLGIIAEGVTGLALIAFPATVGWLLLGQEPDTAGVALGRLAGVGLACFAVACWPTGSRVATPAPPYALWLLQVGMATCLVFIALGTGLAGALLWPGVAYHLGAAIVLLRLFRRTAS